MDGQMKLPADILYAILCSIPRREIRKYAAVNQQFYVMVKRRIDDMNYLDDEVIRTFIGGSRLPPVTMDEVLMSLTQDTRTRLAGEIRAVRDAVLDIVGEWKLSEQKNFRNYLNAIGLDGNDEVTLTAMLPHYLHIGRQPGSVHWWIGLNGFDEIEFNEGLWFDEILLDGTQLRSLAASNVVTNKVTNMVNGVLVILRTKTGEDGIRHTIATESYRVVGEKLHITSHAIKGVDRLSPLERCGRIVWMVLRRLCHCGDREIQEAATGDEVSATRIYEMVAE